MILMPSYGERPPQTRTAGCSKQRSLHIVNGKGIAGEEAVDITKLNQTLEVFARPGERNGLAGHGGDLAVVLHGLHKFTGDLANYGAFWLVSANRCVDKLEQ